MTDAALTKLILDNRVKSPHEVKIERMMEVFESGLPEFGPQDYPEDFLYLVRTTWREVGRDGRRNHIGDGKLSDLIAERAGEPFSRNRYQSTFGAGRPLRRYEHETGYLYLQPMSPAIARAFLEIAFEHWLLIQDEFFAFPFTKPIDVSKAIANACIWLFADGRPVYCRPAQTLIGADRKQDISGLLKKLVAVANGPISIEDIEYFSKFAAQFLNGIDGLSDEIIRYAFAARHKIRS